MWVGHVYELSKLSKLYELCELYKLYERYPATACQGKRVAEHEGTPRKATGWSIGTGP